MDDRLRAVSTVAVEGRVFPGTSLGYIRDGQRHVVTAGGLTYADSASAVSPDTLYDLASVTKSLPTASLALYLIQIGQLGLDDPVVKFVPELNNACRDQVLVRHLLTFTVGFDLGDSMANLAQNDPAGLMAAILSAPLFEVPGTMYRYTNAPSLVLGMVIERATGRSLPEFADEVLFEALAMDRTTFEPLSLSGAQVAPSADDLPAGQIHDPGGRALAGQGSTPGHAGLFSTVNDLLNYGAMLLAGGRTDEGKRIFTPETIVSMGTPAVPELSLRPALGWDTAVGRREIVGPMPSDSAFLKTGFTGTMLLIDPPRQIAFVQLANRTYPQTSDWQPMHDVWRQLIDMIWN